MIESKKKLKFKIKQQKFKEISNQGETKKLINKTKPLSLFLSFAKPRWILSRG
jgi:hypothetical protein